MGFARSQPHARTPSKALQYRLRGKQLKLPLMAASPAIPDHTASTEPPKVWTPLPRHALALGFAAVAAACTTGQVGSGDSALDAQDSGNETPADAAINAPDADGLDTGGTDSTGSGGDDQSTGGSSTSTPDVIFTETLPSAVCTPELALYQGTPTTVVGDGTPTSCTEATLRAAFPTTSNNADGATPADVHVTFNCGDDPISITLTETIDLPVDRDTVIDGGGTIALDGGGQVRLLRFHNEGGWQSSSHKVVLQRLVLQNGQAPTGEYFPPPDDGRDCAYGYKEGSGGAIQLRNGNLEVIDSVFSNNQAAILGPDVGGGAIYARGCPSVIISGSVFKGNQGANGGAVGCLHSPLTIVNTRFENNYAQGVGMNFVVDEAQNCGTFNHVNQGGAGGLGGAVYADGYYDPPPEFIICGSTFRDNGANEMAGALFRTPNRTGRSMRITDSTFEGNTANLGGGTFIKDHAVTVSGSTFMDNQGGVLVDGTPGGGSIGGLWINRGTVEVENSTFYNNSPSGLTVDNRATPGDNSDGGPDSPGVARYVTFAASPIDGDLTASNSIFVNMTCQSPLAGTLNLQWPENDACVEGITYVDPALAAPTDNGGPTPTMLPASTAPLDIGQDCPATDQRGEPRSGCAVGAVDPTP